MSVHIAGAVNADSERIRYVVGRFKLQQEHEHERRKEVRREMVCLRLDALVAFFASVKMPQMDMADFMPHRELDPRRRLFVIVIDDILAVFLPAVAVLAF